MSRLLCFLSHTRSHHPTHQLAARQRGLLNGVYFYICVQGENGSRLEVKEKLLWFGGLG